MLQKFTQDIQPANTVKVVHGLKTKDVLVAMWDSQTGDQTQPDIVVTDENTVTLQFGNADDGTYRIVIIG